jgi:hypothetical protein
VERYHVFGRTTYPDPLEFQGTLTAADHRQAAGQALERHGRRWVELVLLPEASIHWILGPQPVGPEGSGEPQGGAPVDRAVEDG